MMQVNPDRYRLKTFSIDGKPGRTIGGLQITPDLSIDDVTVPDAEMLILPGGASWEQGGHHQVALLAQKFRQHRVTVAAICGATLGLAKIGLLDALRHTSNSKDYLLQSQYQGAEYYVEEPAVNDGGIITASERPLWSLPGKYSTPCSFIRLKCLTPGTDYLTPARRRRLESSWTR